MCLFFCVFSLAQADNLSQRRDRLTDPEISIFYFRDFSLCVNNKVTWGHLDQSLHHPDAHQPKTNNLWKHANALLARKTTVHLSCTIIVPTNAALTRVAVPRLATVSEFHRIIINILRCNDKHQG